MQRHGRRAWLLGAALTTACTIDMENVPVGVPAGITGGDGDGAADNDGGGGHDGTAENGVPGEAWAPAQTGPDWIPTSCRLGVAV